MWTNVEDENQGSVFSLFLQERQLRKKGANADFW